MPDTYTKEQIDIVMELLEQSVILKQPLVLGFNESAILLAALSTAEQERDEAQGIADQMCDEFQRIKVLADNSEIAALCDRAMLKLKQTVPIIVRAEKSDAERNALAARCAELEARLQEAGLIRVGERLPEALERVLVFYVNDLGKNRIDIGQHIPSKTVLAEDFLDENAEGCSEYDSGNDCYWVIEGWWEDSLEAEMNYKISGTITHWMPLPEPPILSEKEDTP